METVLSILDKTTTYFQKHGIENARLDAELLLSHVLECKRMQLYLDFERPLPESTLASLRPLLKKRANREPLQYLIGSTSFMDFTLKTDPRALIPRPETEELVELILAHFDKRAKPERILDLGTGTGAIACALARAFPDAEVMATDLSETTLTLARENIERLALQQKIHCLQSHWFQGVTGVYDLIVSNPPYLADHELETLEPEVGKFEPHRALASGPSGLEAIEVLLTEAPKFLRKNGVIFLETGCSQESAIRSFARELGQEPRLECFKDLNHRHRFVRLEMG